MGSSLTNKQRSQRPGGVIIGGHVQGLDLVRSLGLAKIPAWVVDTGVSLASYSRYCRKLVRCPEYHQPEFIEFLIDLCQRQGLYGWVLYPTNDLAVVNLALNHERLSQFYRLITPPYDVVKAFYLKKNTLDICQQQQISHPRTWYPATISIQGCDLSFPVLVRGVEGLKFYRAFKKKAFTAQNDSELLEVLTMVAETFPVEQVLVQEIIPLDPGNHGFSFTSFAVDGEVKTYWSWIKIREHPLRYGTSTCCLSYHEPRLNEPAARMLKAVRYTGVSEIEFLHDPRDDRFKLIEVNARTILQSSLARRCGINFALLIYNYLNDLPQTYPESYQTGIYWIHFWTDLFFGIQAIIRKEHRLQDIIRTYLKPKELAVFSLRDISPFVMETLLLPYLMIKR